MTSYKWALICGAMNAAAVAIVAISAGLAGIPEWMAYLAGLPFVVASVIPFGKAQKAFAAEKAAEAAL